MNKKLHIAVVGVAAVVALTACSPGTTDNGGDGSRDVNLQLYNQPTTFSPFIPQTGGNQLIQTLNWDSLVGIDADGAFEPRLAESWSVSDDGLVWTFDLRDGVKWSDGEPFTADDVVFSYNLYANPITSASSGNLSTVVGADAIADGSATTASGFEAVDDDTFTMTLTAPNTAKLIDLAEPQLFIVPEHVYKDLPHEGLPENPIFREPKVGIGPYIFSKWVSDDQVEFVPNPEYRTELGLDHVYTTFMATDAAQAQLQAGELDFAQVAAADASRIEGLDGVTLQDVPGIGIMGLHNAYDNGKLADPKVRQAIMYSIDREALVDKVLAGYGKVVDTVSYGPEWAVPDDLTHYTRDIPKAKELLAEAGWDPATVVNLEIVPGPKDREQVLTIIAGQMQEAGINAQVKQVDGATLTQLITDREFDLLISGYGLFGVDPASMDATIACGSSGISKFCDPKLDELLKAGVATNDQEERAAIYRDALRIVNEELPIFPLYVPDTLAATSARLQGFTLNPLATNAFWNAAEWTVG